ncbi:MAG: polysaccharide deacetylase family protein, partial [Butyricicoccaceae bacterium]
MKRPLLLLSALLCLAACLLLTAAPAPLPVSAPAPAAPRLLALTFDDGPHPTCTDRILDTLAAYDAHATFFVLGSKIESSLPQLARMVNEGHMIANHTWDHLDLTKLDAQTITRQIGSVYG